MDTEAVKQMMMQRATHIRAAIRAAGRSSRAREVPGVRLLAELLSAGGGPRQELVLEFPASRQEAPTYLDWVAVEKGQGLRFRVPPEVVEKFCEVMDQAARVGVRFNFWHFDLFLIHELVHTYQGMERGKHRGYQRLAPALLRALDYQADSLAVITLYALLVAAPKHFLVRFDFVKLKRVARGKLTWWQRWIVDGMAAMAGALGSRVGRFDTLRSIVHAQLWHLSVFTASMVDTRKPGRDPQRSLEIASGFRFPLAKLERTMAWYLQYYRCRYYRRDGLLSQLDLLKEPMFEFRNLRAAVAVSPDWLKADWPANEAAFIANHAQAHDPADTPAIILALTGLRGTTRILRWNPPNGSTTYSALFQSLFDSRFVAAEPFFKDLFLANPWLIGFDDDPVRDSEPNVQEVGAALSRDNSRLDLVDLDTPSEKRRLLRDLGGLL